MRKTKQVIYHLDKYLGVLAFLMALVSLWLLLRLGNTSKQIESLKTEIRHATIIKDSIQYVPLPDTAAHTKIIQYD